MKEKEKKGICKRVIIKYAIRAFLVFIISFAIGAGLQWYWLTEDYQKCINKEYSTNIINGQDFNEWWLEMHDNFSVAYKTEQSFYGGIVWGILGTCVFWYIFMLYKLFSSKEEKKVTIAWVLVVVALICLFIYCYFMANFKIVF